MTDMILAILISGAACFVCGYMHRGEVERWKTGHRRKRLGRAISKLSALNGHTTHRK